MAHVSHKLRTPLQGALAGGGDPATSPLYVFGPFLRLIFAAGVAEVTFGASVWLVIFTIAVVSAMYRLVMHWVTDGSGGSGLTEEEFGGWAVKVNAGITFIEYTLTFLVSMAALVTFAADRFPRLNQTDLLMENRAWLAVGVSILTGWLVNRGPKTTARTFGPATAGVLILLWVMIVATVVETGLRLPDLDLRAFTPTYWGDTFGGYARILAVMTGIEIFANMVAAYEGPPNVRGRKAFQGLLIIMGTTGLTMLIVGPAIFRFSDPFDEEVSVFTQTMDELLPGPLSEFGTVVGIAVLLSASAASALGLQNLFVGLKIRHYVPPTLGRLNRFGVASRPVWIEVGIASIAYLAFGTHEETYLALYAAGVFILLAMTGWAATKRLIRHQRDAPSWRGLLTLAGAALASVLTTGATFIIFGERFTEGAWTYLVFVPTLYLTFGYFRRILGPPSSVHDRVGAAVAGGTVTDADTTLWSLEADRGVRRILIPVDGSDRSLAAAAVAVQLREALDAELMAVSVGDQGAGSEVLGVPVEVVDSNGGVVSRLCQLIHDRDIDLVVISTHGRTGLKRVVMGSVTEGLVRGAQRPLLVLPSYGDDAVMLSPPRRLLVALDGSRPAERVLPYATAVAAATGSGVVLTHVPFDLADDHTGLESYLDSVSAPMVEVGIPVSKLIGGRDPAVSLPELARDEHADLILLATHGRGGLERVVIGSVADAVIRSSSVPVLLVPIVESRVGPPSLALTGR